MFIVIEIQTDGSVATIVNQYATINEAEAKFHQILAAAAVSSVPVHAAVILSNTGSLVRFEYFSHGVDEDHLYGNGSDIV